MANQNIFDAFKQSSEHLGPEVYRRDSFQNDAFLNLVPRGTFPRGVGLVKTMFDVGNVYPETDERPWDSYNLATGSNTGACAYNFTDYQVGYNELTYSPSHFQLRGPRLCKDELYFSHEAATFLDAYLEELTKLVAVELANKLELEYRNLVPKAVLTAALPITAAGAPMTALPEATSDLTQEALDKIAVHLFQNRAATSNTGGWVSRLNGGPVYTLYVGQEASQSIMYNNSEFRQDLRDQTQNQLLTRMGANTAIKNFRHVINPTPPRFTFSGGTYTRVNTYGDQNPTKGQFQDLRDAWKDEASAPYEGAYIMNADVMTWDWVMPDNVVAGQRWDPFSYTGEWKFITGAEAAAEDGTGYDPAGKFGRHIAELAGAPKPGKNRSAGLLIIFKRCHLSTITTATCS